MKRDGTEGRKVNISYILILLVNLGEDHIQCQGIYQEYVLYRQTTCELGFDY